MYKNYKVNILKPLFIWMVIFNFFTSVALAETNEECIANNETEIGCRIGIHKISNLGFSHGDAVAVDGKYAYVSTSGGDLRIIDISNKTHMKEVSFTDIHHRLFDLKIRGHYLFGRDGNGICIVDISDVSNPSIISTIKIDSSSSSNGYFVNDKFIYDLSATMHGQDVVVVDISNILEPKIIKKIDINNFYGYGSFSKDFFLGVGKLDNAWKIITVDMRDKNNISIVDELEPQSINNLNTYYNVKGIVGNFFLLEAYTHEGDRRIQIYTIHSDGSLTLKKEIETNAYLSNVYIHNDKLYFLFLRGKIKIYDKNTLEDINQFMTGEANDISISNNYLYSISFTIGLSIYDISNPSKDIVYKDTHSYLEKDVAREFFIDGDYMYASFKDKGIKKFDISNMTNPVEIATNINDSWGLYVDGKYLYSVSLNNGLNIYNKNNLNLVKHKDINGSSIAIKDGYAYISNHNSGVSVWNMSDLNHIVNINSKLKYSGNYGIYNLCISNNILYLGHTGRGSNYDISDPTNIKDIYSSGYNNYVACRGDMAWVATGDNINNGSGLRRVEVKKGYPNSLTNFDFDLVRSKKVKWYEHYLFVSDFTGIKIINIENPNYPVLVGKINTFFKVGAIAIKDDYIIVSFDSNKGFKIFNWKVAIFNYKIIQDYYNSTKFYITSPNESNIILYKSITNSNVKILDLKSENFIENKTNWLVKIDAKEIDKSNKKEFTTSFDYSDYTLGEHTLEIFLLDENAKELDKKVITLNIEEEKLDYSIDKIVITDEYSNEYASDSVPTNKPLIIVADTNINTIEDITFTWSIDGKIVKEGLGVDNSYLDYTFTKPETTILVSIKRENEKAVSKELKVSTLLDTLEDLRAIGENRKIVVENGYFEEGIDRTGDYYAPTGNRLGIYDSKSNELIVNIKLTDPSAVKIYNNQIIGTDGSAYITFTDDKLPLFEGKFIIEDEVLRNLLLAEALNEEKLNRVIDADKYCEGVTKYETLENNTKKQDCKELIDNTKLDRKLVKFLSDNIVPVTDATLLVGIDADAIGLSPALLATPYLWDGKLDLAKKKFKLTALASAASVFNLKGDDYSLLSNLADTTPTSVKTSLLSTAKSLGRIPFVYTLKSDGSATTEIGKSKLHIKALTLKFSDSKSLVLESKVIKTSDNDKHRKNTATIKNAKAYLSLNKNKEATNIGFQINNAKLEERDGTYELLSYDGGANLSIPNIPLGNGRSLENISGGIYFVGRSSVYDTDDWPVAFIDKRKGVKSKFYIYLKGHGEYVKESAPNKVNPNDPLGSMNSAWTNGDDYKNTLTVDFKVIPLAVANYDNGLLLSADIGYSTDGTSNIVNIKGFKLKELEGKYRYDTNLDDFLWKVTAGVETLKYRGKGSLYWNWGENLALGGTVKDFGLSITNNKRFILGDGCILGGTLTPTFMNLAECPKLTSSCASNIGLSKNTLISNGFMFGMKATPHYESRFSATSSWENPFPYLEASAELGFKVIMDEKVKKGNSNRFQFSDPKITANLAGSGSLSMKIPKSKSSYFPFPTKDITLLELCVGMSPFDVKRYYDEGLFVTTEKVDNIKGLFGFYGMAKLADKNAVVFYSFMPFKIKDVDEEQTWLYGTNFTIEVKDTVSKHKQGQYRKISKTSNSTFKMNKIIDGENAIETLVIPENNSGPLVLVKNVNNVEITTPSGEVVNANNVEEYSGVAIEKEDSAVTIGLNNPEAGTWKFKFKNNKNYEFLVFSENLAPTVDASLDTTSIEYGQAIKLNLDYKDADSSRGFIKVVATSSEGEEFVLFDDNITVPYNDSINLYIPKLGKYDLTLFATDGLRAYSKISLDSVTITEPSKFIDNLKVTTGKNSLVSEWKSLNLVKSFDVTIFNKTTSIKNVYDKVSSNFTKSNLVNGEYTLTVDARYNGKIVDTLHKDFVINSDKICEPMDELIINEDFTDDYFLNFATSNASYYSIDIQSLTDRFKYIERKQVNSKIDISSFVGEGISITIKAIDKCGETLSKSKELIVSNQIDKDNDSLYDDWEIHYFGNLNQSDTDDFDSDGVNNLNEMKHYLDPTNSDTDADKISDKDDVNPHLNIDSNQNHIPDDWENFYSIQDLSLDPDGDGVSSYDEYFLGTNPNVKDNNNQGDNNQGDNKAPVIQTDKDNFKTLTTLLSENLIINASTSFDSDHDSLNYSWKINNKVVSTSDIFNYKFKKLGKHYLRLTLSDGNNHSVSKEWLIFITKESYNFEYTTIDKSDISIYHSGVEFTIPKSVGRGEIFTIEIPLKDLPVKPKGYTFIEKKGKVIIFNGKNKLNNKMSIEHVSNDQLLRYSYTENKWYIVAYEGKSVKTSNIGLFALASKNKNTITSDSGNSSGGGCFIATAAYGSYLQKDVEFLRVFRDKYLLTNKLGKSFVDTYYHYSPPIANYIAQHDYLRTIVRWILTGIIFIIKYPWVVLLILSLLIFRRKVLHLYNPNYQ